ncbi:MAG: PAS domain-containing protein [Candidatus Omnitrophica bacterium]|nr:PAS domain-containing protein [Candidatus Omnitrophota bacterium]
MNEPFFIDVAAADKLGIGIFRYSISPAQKFISVNSVLARLLEYPSVDALLPVTMDSIFFNLDEKEVFLKKLREQGNVTSYETLFRTFPDRRAWVAIKARYTRLEDTGVEYFDGVIEDISSRKILEEQLSLEKDFFQNLLDNMPDAIYFKDSANRLIKVNKFYAQGARRPAEEIIGKTDFDFFPRDQAEKMFADDNYILKTGRAIVGKIERTLLVDGSWNQVITTKIPMYDRTGEIIGTMGITRDMTEYANLEKERLSMMVSTLAVLGKALEMRDPYTFSHVRHVAGIAERICKELGWDENRRLGMKLAGELHDLGKISIPLDILNKPGRLSDLEYSLVQEHVIKCYNLIKDIEFPFSLAEIVYQHHERLDGSGYPRQLKGEEILPEARILAVSDVLESMTCYRPYREALGVAKAMEELNGGCGSKYDPYIVGIVRGLVDQNNGKAFWENN